MLLLFHFVVIFTVSVVVVLFVVAGGVGLDVSVDSVITNVFVACYNVVDVIVVNTAFRFSAVEVLLLLLLFGLTLVVV